MTSDGSNESRLLNSVTTLSRKALAAGILVERFWHSPAAKALRLTKVHAINY